MSGEVCGRPPDRLVAWLSVTRAVAAVVAAGIAFAALAGVAAGSRSAVDAQWRRAAGKLAMPIFAPSKTAGLALTKVVPKKLTTCGSIKEQLDAYYAKGAATLRIAEGSPAYCADFGDAPVVAQLKVHGQPGFLLDYCEGTGCPAKNTFLLSWAEKNVRMILISRGIAKTSLLSLAASMRVVPG